nr:immunoglobulin light chain junction region [Macaca mulatta]
CMQSLEFPPFPF